MSLIYKHRSKNGLIVPRLEVTNNLLVSGVVGIAQVGCSIQLEMVDLQRPSITPKKTYFSNYEIHPLATLDIKVK